MTVTENVVHLYARVDDGVEQFLFRPRTLAGEDRVRAYRDALSGCVYDGDQKAFVTTPSLSYAVVTRLRSAGFEVLPKGPAEAKFQRVSAEHWADLQALKDRIAYFDSELGKRRHPTSGKRLRLLDYQKAGVEWLSSRTRALLADDQGLGKSCQVLTAAPADAPILVASPKTVKLAWVREVAIWRPGLRVHAVAKKEDFRFPRAGELVVANFELLPSLHVGGCEREEVYECDGCSPLLVDGAPGHLPDCRVGEKKGCDGCAPLVRDLQRGTILVVDELHFAKSRKTRRHDVVRTLARACLQRGGRAWGATGTPLVNRYEELWNVLEVLDCAREAYGSFWKFAELHGGKPKLVEKHVRGVGRKTVQKGWTWGDVQPWAAD